VTASLCTGSQSGRDSLESYQARCTTESHPAWVVLPSLTFGIMTFSRRDSLIY
jgi:hypothetical protein